MMATSDTAAPSLTRLADRYGSDKGVRVGDGHGTTLIYDLLFHGLRDKPLRMLEIGLQVQYLDGAPTVEAPSIQMWLDYFPRAEVVGFDIRDFSHLARERFTFVRGDQASVDDLAGLAAAGPFDIVIDDGPHGAYHQQLAMAQLLPQVRDGGLYIVEDIGYQPKDLDAGYNTPRTGDSLYHFVKTGHLLTTQDLTAAQVEAVESHIGSVFLFPEAGLPDGQFDMAVVKKASPDNNYVAVTNLLPHKRVRARQAAGGGVATRVVEDGGQDEVEADAPTRLADRVRHEIANGRSEAALDLAARAGVEGAATCEVVHLRGGLLEKQGNKTEAARLFQRHVGTCTPACLCLKDYGRLLREGKYYQEALRILEQAMAADPSDPRAALHLGLAAEGVGQTERARDALAHAYVACQPDKEVAYHLGRLYTNLDQHADAEAVLDWAAATWPDTGWLQYGASVCKQKQGKLDEALGYVRQALKVQKTPKFMRQLEKLMAERDAS